MTTVLDYSVDETVRGPHAACGQAAEALDKVTDRDFPRGFSTYGVQVLVTAVNAYVTDLIVDNRAVETDLWTLEGAAIDSMKEMRDLDTKASKGVAPISANLSQVVIH